MPLYTVKLRVNVPTLGERIIDVIDIGAVDMSEAIARAAEMVVIEPLVVTKKSTPSP